MDKKIKIEIVEDDKDFCYLIKCMLQTHPNMEIVACCHNKKDAVSMAQKVSPDIVLMDLNLSYKELDGINAARQIRLTTKSKIIILTAFDDPETVIEASVNALASGYVFKSQFEYLIQTILVTAKGNTPQECLINAIMLSELSTAERAVFQRMMGKPVSLQSATKTIANQKSNIYKKLNLKNQAELLHVFKNFG